MSVQYGRFSKFFSRNQMVSRNSKRHPAIGSAVSATLESLEPRQLLSGTPVLTISGAPTANEGQDYVLNLNASPDPTLTSWTINWGDGQSDVAVPIATTSLAHKYVDSTTPYHVTATATDGSNVFPANSGGSTVTGTPDPGFNLTGILVVAGKPANAVAVQVDGKILVVSSTTNGMTTTRYNVDGSLDDGTVTDTTPGDFFGTGGSVSTNFDGTTAYGNAIAVQSDGNIVVAGDALLFSTNRVGVVRYKPNGSLDTSFGPNGDGIYVFRFVSPNSNGGSVVSLAIDNNATSPNLGKIILGGITGTAGDGHIREIFAGRLNANGTTDTTFGTIDTATNLPSGYVAYPGTASDIGGQIALQSDDKVVVVGRSADHGAIIRFNADGSLDTSFGVAGKYATPTLGFLSAVAVDASGSIVATGVISDNASIEQWTVIRVSSLGVPDLTFSPVFSRPNNSAPVATLSSIAIQTDGKILVTGSTDSNGGSSDFATVRYNVDGTLDSSFGNGGAVVTDFGTPIDTANAMVLLPGGRILVAGGTNAGGVTSLVLQQFGLTASATPVIVFVADVAPVVTLSSVPLNSPEGVAISVSASVVDFTPANLTNTWAVTKDGTPFVAGVGTAINFVPTDNGTYVLTFTSNDTGGTSASVSSTINVTNVAPTASVTADAIGAIGVRGQNRKIHIPVATDPSSADTAAGFSYTVNWGDGTTSQIARTTAASDPSHIYKWDGNYHITVTATDKDNAPSAAATLNMAITPVALEGNILAIGGLTRDDLIIITQTGSGTNKIIHVSVDFLLNYNLNESLFKEIDIYQSDDDGTFVARNVTDAVYLVDAYGNIIETIHAAR